MSQIAVQTLLQTKVGTIRDIACNGACRHRSAEECATETHLVFPYRGVFQRHLGRDDAVAEANQVLFFNDSDSYHISHPVDGGDACLSFAIDAALLQELAPKDQLRA